MTINRPVLLPLLVGSVTLCWSLSQAQPQTAAPQAPNTTNDGMELPVVTRANDAFGPVNEALRSGDLAAAEKLLRELKAKGLKPDQFNRWEQLASRTALRQGNAKWLEEVNQGAALGDTANDVLILGAMRFLLASDLKQARALLLSVQDPQKLGEISERRYMELWMRLEQLSGNPKEERKWAEKLVDFAASWDDPSCRSCHDNPKTHPGEVSTLDLKGWWVGQRYSQLLDTSGDALSEVNLAKTKLAKDPKAVEARLRLAYALRAMNKAAESETELRSFPWAKFPDRPEKKPLRFAQFP